MPVRNVPLTEAGPLVRDVMLIAPDTVPATTTVRDALPLLDSPRLRMLLVSDGDRLVGSIARERLESEPDQDLALGRLADPGSARIGPDEVVAQALRLLEAAGAERLPVVGEGDRLLGLVCFNPRKRHFCVDATS